MRVRLFSIGNVAVAYLALARCDAFGHVVAPVVDLAPSRKFRENYKCRNEKCSVPETNSQQNGLLFLFPLDRRRIIDGVGDANPTTPCRKVSIILQG